MAAKISVLLPSRSNVNGIAAFERSLSSLVTMVKNPDDVEILIKLDNDDPKLEDYKQLIEDCRQYKVKIETIVSSRANGYKSLHEHYINLMLISSEETLMYFVLCDDTEIVYNGWDELLIKTAEEYGDDMFVIHPTYFENLKGKTAHDCMQSCEPFPIWSREWIHTQGFFGYTFSTDGWTSITENNLYQKYGIDKRIKLEQTIIKRHQNNNNDGVGTERWNGIRRETIKLHIGKKFDDLLNANTDKLAMRIINGKSISNTAAENYANHLKNNLLDLYDKDLINNEKINHLYFELNNLEEEARPSPAFNFLAFEEFLKNKKNFKTELKRYLKEKNLSGLNFKIKLYLIKNLLRITQKILK